MSSKHKKLLLLQRNEANLLQLQSLADRAKKTLQEKAVFLRSVAHNDSQLWLQSRCGRMGEGSCLINSVSFLFLAEVLSGCVILDGVNNISGLLVRKCRDVSVPESGLSS